MNARPQITRFKAGGIHLLASGLVAALSATLVFVVWYPSPYATLAGGTGLFLLIVSVDVVLGPALTAVVANPNKKLAELTRDLAVIVIVQLAAFGYGLYTMALARPVLLAFEVDRLRVVTAADIDPVSLADAPPGLQSLSWTGPRLIAAVKPGNPDEQMKSIELGLAGVDLSMQPKQWRGTPHTPTRSGASPALSLCCFQVPEACCRRDRHRAVGRPTPRGFALSAADVSSSELGLADRGTRCPGGRAPAGRGVLLI